MESRLVMKVVNMFIIGSLVNIGILTIRVIIIKEIHIILMGNSSISRSVEIRGNKIINIY